MVQIKKCRPLALPEPPDYRTARDQGGFYIKKAFFHIDGLGFFCKSTGCKAKCSHDFQIIDLLQGNHQGVKKALFFPHCAFFQSYNAVILPQKAFVWIKNDSFFPPR